MRAARLLPPRLRRFMPEAFAFGVIGALNSVLYFVIFNAAMQIGAVKATVIATVVTTTLSYLANRHWTYKHRPRTALKREYTLFFVFNFAGMVIQAVAVGIGKYGLGLTEDRDRLAFNVFTLIGVALATVFRFWAYRTFVFLKAPVNAPVEAPVDNLLANLDPAAELAHVLVGQPTAPHPRVGGSPAPHGPVNGRSTTTRDSATDDPTTDGLDAEIAAEIDAARRPAAR